MPRSFALRFSILAAAVAVVFGPTLAAPFHLDDLSLFPDPAVTRADGLFYLLEKSRPLTYATFWLNYQLSGASAWPYHLTNILLHFATILMVWRVLKRLLPGEAPFVAALLFAIHPVQVEPVAWIFGRAIILAALGCMASLWCWLRGWRIAAVLCFALALAAKEEVVAFPLFLALLHVTISRNREERGWIAAMLGLSLLAGLRVSYIAATTAESGAGAQAGISAVEYFAAQGVALWRYAQLLFVPVGLTVDPAVRIPPAWLAAVFWLGLLIVITMLYVTNGSKARAGFWVAAAFLLILPSSSIFPADDLAADRRLYLPMFALSAAAGLVLIRWNWRVTAAIAGIFGVLAFSQSWVWRSERSLWMQAVGYAPNKVRPYLQLARNSRGEEALQWLEQARKIAPGDPRIPAEQGRIQLQQGNSAAALEAFGRQLALEPRNARAFNNRGAALLALDQDEAAIQDLRQALTLEPCLFDALYNLRVAGVELQAPEQCRFGPEQDALLRKEMQ